MKHFISNSKQLIALFILLLASFQLPAEDGYDLWLRYKTISNEKLLASYRHTISGINITTGSPTLLAAKEELEKGRIPIFPPKALFLLLSVNDS